MLLAPQLVGLRLPAVGVGPALFAQKTLDAAYSQVLAAKKSLYAAYCEEQRKLKELLVHRENLRPYLAPQEPQTQ